MRYKYKSGVQSGVQSGVPNEIQVIECDMFRHFCQILIGYKSHNLKEVWVLEVWTLDWLKFSGKVNVRMLSPNMEVSKS